MRGAFWRAVSAMRTKTPQAGMRLAVAWPQDYR